MNSIRASLNTWRIDQLIFYISNKLWCGELRASISEDVMTATNCYSMSNKLLRGELRTSIFEYAMLATSPYAISNMLLWRVSWIADCTKSMLFYKLSIENVSILRLPA